VQAHPERAEELGDIRKCHDASLGVRIGEGADERREQYVSGNEELLDQRPAPDGIMQFPDEPQCRKQEGVVGQGGKKLRDQRRDHAAGP
jgi:hypothetical protein